MQFEFTVKLLVNGNRKKIQLKNQIKQSILFALSGFGQYFYTVFYKNVPGDPAKNLKKGRKK